jgi:hypothetical protein
MANGRLSVSIAGDVPALLIDGDTVNSPVLPMAAISVGQFAKWAGIGRTSAWAQIARKENCAPSKLDDVRSSPTMMRRLGFQRVLFGRPPMRNNTKQNEPRVMREAIEAILAAGHQDLRRPSLCQLKVGDGALSTFRNFFLLAQSLSIQRIDHDPCHRSETLNRS